MKKIKLVLGPICSGKTTWCDTQINIDERRDIPSKYVKVSDVVKSLSSATTRSELQQTGELDSQISSKLINLLDRDLLHTYDIVYVDGVRQISIMMDIINHFAISEGEDVPVDLVWLEVESDERRRRFITRKQPRDLDVTFDEANANDYMLGLDKIKQFINNVSIIK